MYRLRGRLLPLVDLTALLFPDEGRVRGWNDDKPVNIAVLEADDRRFGLVVDGIHDHEDIVVKPLHKQLKAFPVFAGATILGDGRPALILDVAGVARRAGLASAKRRAQSAAPAAADRAAPAAGLLLFAGVHGGRMAIPLPVVDRLELVSPAAVEKAGNQAVVQYGGGILPLIDVSAALRESTVIAGAKPPAADALPDCRVLDGDRARRAARRPHPRHRGRRAGGEVPGVAPRHPPLGRGRRSRHRVRGRRGARPHLDPGPVRTARGPGSTGVAMTDERRFCTFGLAGRRFGLDVLRVREVIRHQDFTRVPLAPREVTGLLNLRGEVVMAVDLRRRLDFDDRPAGKLPAVVVVQSDDGPIGFLVDEIGEVEAVGDDRFEPPPDTVRGRVRGLIRAPSRWTGICCSSWTPKNWGSSPVPATLRRPPKHPKRKTGETAYEPDHQVPVVDGVRHPDCRPVRLRRHRLLVRGPRVGEDARHPRFQRRRARRRRAVPGRVPAARRAEKDFLLHPSNEEAAKVGESLKQVRTLLKTIRQVSSGPEREQDVAAAGQAVDTYERQFNEMLVAFRKRGLTHDEGLELELRNAVHAIEKSVSEQSLPELSVLMLLCRRHEKDYIIRDDEKWLKDIPKHIEDFKAKMKKSELPADVQANITAQWKAYWDSLQELVAAERIVETPAPGFPCGGPEAGGGADRSRDGGDP